MLVYKYKDKIINLKNVELIRKNENKFNDYTLEITFYDDIVHDSLYLNKNIMTLYYPTIGERDYAFDEIYDIMNNSKEI